MRARTLLVLLCALSSVAGCGRETQPTPVAEEAGATTAPSDEPVILIYDRDLGIRVETSPTAPPKPALQAAVWADGRIVWRVDRVLLQGKANANAVDAFLQQFQRDGAFGAAGIASHRHFGPDSSYEVIDVRVRGKSLRMESWHEGFERNPNLVATSHGITGLNGRSRDAVLAAEPAEYRRFRKLWSDVRDAVQSWTPATGEPFTGTVPLRGG